MADIVTVKQLQNASLDTQTLETFVNGNETQVNKPRLLPNVDVGSIAELRKKVQDKVDLQIATLPSGHKGYPTLAAAQAAQASLPANTLVEVTNDTTNNGVYLWNGTTLTKSTYDPKSVAVAEAKTYANAMFEQKQTIPLPFVKGYVYHSNGVRIQTADPWYSTDKFYLKKGQSISFSVFTPSGLYTNELGSLIVFDTNGSVISTRHGTYGSNDRNQRVNTIYTASQDCYVALQSIHNIKEGYDGLDDYCVIYDSDMMLSDYFKTRLSQEQQNINGTINWATETGYLISYFGENDVGQDLILAYSKNGINFKEFHRFVPPTTNTIRDPSIILHKNGWWYVCHTNTPYGVGFTSEKFNIIKSRDLINWYQVGRLGFDGVQNWAPEFFVDDDGSVHIIASINLDGTFQPYIFSALDDDLATWSSGKKIQGAFNSASTSTSSTWIDGYMFKIGTEYHLIIKDEDHKWLTIFKSTSLKSGFDTIVKDGAKSWGAISQQVEAPCVVKIDNGYRIYVDGLSSSKSGLGLMYQDFDANFNPITSNITKITSDTPMRHGTVIKVTGLQRYLTQANFVADNVADTATADDTASILAELRNLKSALIDAGLMRLN